MTYVFPQVGPNNVHVALSLVEFKPELQKAMEFVFARLLCPQTSPGKNTGVSCHSLLQGIFLTQGSNQVSSIASRLSELRGKPPDPRQNMCYANIPLCVFVYMHVLVFNAVFISHHNKKWCSIHFDLKRMVTIYDIESLCEVK